MKSKFLLILAAALITTPAHAKPLVLPDSCGSEKIDFDVDTKKDQPAPAAPEEGKAQIVFIEKSPYARVTRFGVDGAWVGATKGNSYFTVSVAPGKHHLCAYAEGNLLMHGFEPGVKSLLFEAGKTYYLKYTLSVDVSHDARTSSATFDPLEADEGAYLIKKYPLSQSKAK